jgi:pyruvate dehydrogenase E2 component (dihydrolipoamide acetyltransferase)
VAPRELTMPKLSDSMADAVILRWLKSVGEAFARGEELIEVETDKATVIYEAEWDGTLEAILAPEGATVAVGEPIATLVNGDGAAGPGAGPVRLLRSEQAPPPPTADPAAAVMPEAGGSVPARLVATPVARRAAVELGVSLHGLVGTGPGGRITVGDVKRAASESDVAPPPPAYAPLTGKGAVSVHEPTPTQATIARRMVESATTIPVFTVSADVDVSQIVSSRRQARERGETAPSVNDFVVKAVATTLREFPRFNASYVDGKVECYSSVNVGVAVATDDALLVPVVRDADRKSLARLAEESRALVDGARQLTLRPEDFQDGTFTVSNLGMFGVRAFTAIVDPPQVAILAVGGARRAAVEERAERIAFHDLLTVTLSCDHRVVYGADGARFLSHLRELLERPLTLAL